MRSEETVPRIQKIEDKIGSTQGRPEASEQLGRGREKALKDGEEREMVFPSLSQRRGNSCGHSTPF